MANGEYNAGATGRRMAMIVGYAPGVFDLFHIGHLNVLRHAKSACDHLIAGVVSDDLAAEVKGGRPVIPLRERLEIVASIDYVDEAIVENHRHKIDTWRVHPFDVIFKGDDWRGTEKGAALEREFAEVGVTVMYFPYTVRTSSTLLRETLESLRAERTYRLA
jgi:glycerol-3-phosphate cytidylyltransferase